MSIPGDADPPQRRSQTRPKLDAVQVGEMLGLRKAYVLDLARKNQIPHVRIGRYCRFDADAIEAWWDARTQGPTGELRKGR